MDYTCPPRMADGRLFTDYRPRCMTQLEHIKPCMSDHDFRKYLTQNGGFILADGRHHQQCATCTAVPVPEVDRFECTPIGCKRVSTGAKPWDLPIGTGRK